MMKIERAYIMAGGSSRRMGKDKLFLSVDGEPLLERTVRVCRRHFDRIHIVAKESAKFQQLDAQVLLDAEEAEGPMAGLITALRHCPDSSCFVTAADFRDLNPTIIETMVAKYNGEQYLGIREVEHLQPLCGIYAVSSLGSLLKAANRGEYGLHKVLADLDSNFVDIETKQWRNVNRPVDLRG